MDYKKKDIYGFKITMAYKILFISFFVTFSSSQLFAQDWDNNTPELDDARVVIEKDRKIELPAASRNYEKVPPLPDDSEEKTLEYSFEDYNFSLQPLDPKIRVLTIQEEKLNKFYGNYVKAGFGNYLTPYLEGFFNNKRNDRYAIGAHVKHLSSRNGPVDDENSGSSENLVGLYGKLFTKPLTFTGDLRYKRNKVYYYGYAPGLEVDRNDIEHIYNSFNVEAGIQSNSSNEDLYYKMDASLNYLADNFEAKESQLGFNFEGRYRLSEILEIGLESDLYLTKLEDNGSVNRNLFRLTPTFTTVFEPIEITAGINVVYENDSLANANKVHFYPKARATYHITDEIKIYGGIDGDLNRTSLQYFADENLFLNQNVQVFNTNKTLEFYGALEGKVFKMLSFKGGFSIGNYKNMYYFVNSATDSSRFDIVYEDGNTSLVNFFGEIGISKSEVFNLVFRTDFYSYGTDTLKEAWHKPNFGLSLLGSYNIYDKILLSAQLAALGGIEGYNAQSERSKSLDTILDLGLKAEYMFSERASAFLSFNNILGNDNERFLYYPSRSLMVMAGVTYSF